MAGAGLAWPEASLRAAFLWRGQKRDVAGRLGPSSGPGGTAVPGSGLDLRPGKVGGAIPVRALWSRGPVELRPVRRGDGACGDGMPGPARI